MVMMYAPLRLCFSQTEDQKLLELFLHDRLSEALSLMDQFIEGTHEAPFGRCLATSAG